MSKQPHFGSIEILKDTIANAPQKPGIYKMIGAEDKILYIGKAKNLPNRLTNYTDVLNLSNRIRQMVYSIQKVEYVITQTEQDALILEASLIRSHNPPFNILLKDDKSLPYIAISSKNPYPQIFKYRGKKQKDVQYFGPFGGTQAAEEVINIVQKLFMLRTCADTEFSRRTRPCLEYGIKRCTAPCVNKVTKEQYTSQVQNAVQFLSGKLTEIQQELSRQMDALAQNMQFEEAIKIRDKIILLTGIQTQKGINFKDFEDTDVICLEHKANLIAVQVFFLRNGMSYGYKNFFFDFDPKISTSQDIFQTFLGQFYENNPLPPTILTNIPLASDQQTQLQQFLEFEVNVKVAIFNPKQGKKLDLVSFTLPNLAESLAKELTHKSTIHQNLVKLKEIFNLPNIPQRIEVFDNSHISGTDFVGVMIVATPEGFLKSDYRKYNASFSQTKAGDDYAMMQEVMQRRYGQNNQSLTQPDLILIDGGKGQMSAVQKVLTYLNVQIPFVCISKGPDRNAGKEKFHMPDRPEFTIDYSSPEMYYLQILRDEAHRFAITTNRNKRLAKTTKSILDQIPNIGSTRKKALLSHFGSVTEIQKASVIDLTKVQGISNALAIHIKEYL